jgi:hypothetical protein
MRSMVVGADAAPPASTPSKRSGMSSGEMRKDGHSHLQRGSELGPGVVDGETPISMSRTAFPAPQGKLYT